MIAVRPCSPADLDALRDRWPTPGEDVHAVHAGGSGTYLVAWSDHEPLGVAVVRWQGCSAPNAAAAHPDAVEVHHLHVRAEHRGTGVGTALLAAAEGLVRERGHPEIALGVDVANTGAARLYERLGFTPTGVHDTTAYRWFDRDGTPHDAVDHDELLVKVLRPADRA